MKNKLMLIIVLGMFLISFTSALDSFGTFKQGSDIRLTQICSDASYVTISSISYPNSTTAITQTNMTHLGSGEFYYNFNDTNELGRYDVRGIADGCQESFAYYFEVTSTGENITQNQGLTIGGLIFFSALLVVIGFTFRPEKWKVRFFFFMCACLIGVLTLNSIKIIASASESLGKMMELGLYLGIIVLLVMFLYFFIYALIEVFSAIKNAKKKKWEFRP